MSDLDAYMARAVGNPFTKKCTCCGKPRTRFRTMTGVTLTICYDCDLVTLWPYSAAS
jgi:hypothetical protein